MDKDQEMKTFHDSQPSLSTGIGTVQYYAAYSIIGQRENIADDWEM